MTQQHLRPDHEPIPAGATQQPIRVSWQSSSLARRGLRFGTIGLIAFWALVAAGTAFLGIGREMEQDETYVIWLDRAGWQHLNHYIRFEPSTPLYHYLMKVWMDLGGTSESWVRTPSSLCFLVSFPVIWWLGRSTFSRAERLGILILLVACKTVNFDAIYCRYFELMYLESCIVFLSFVGLFTGKLSRPLALTLLALGNFAGVMTHYYFAFCLLAEGVAYLLFYRWRRLGDFILGAVVPTVVFGVTWGATFHAQLESGRFINAWKLPNPATMIENTYFAKRWYVILPALLLLILIDHRRGRWGLASWHRLRTKAVRFVADERVRVFAVLWVVTVLSPFLTAMVVGRQFLKSEPFIILASFPFVILLILAVDRSNRWLRVLCGLAVLGLVSVTEGRYRVVLARDGFPATASRAAVSKLIRQGQPNDIVVCLDYYYTILDYYLKQTVEGSSVEVRGFPQELENHPGYSVSAPLKDMAAFRVYAKTYAAEVAQTASGRPGSHVWVCDSVWLPEFTTTIRDAFDGVMDRVDQVEAPTGAGYRTIVGYQSRPVSPPIERE